jgi:site-specific DNA recombinase
LKKPLFFGKMLVKGELYPHSYETIIDEGLFQKVQSVLNGWHKKPFQYSAKPFVFRGLIKCAHCGCTITTEEKKGKHRYLFCSGAKGECGQKRVKEEVLLGQVSEVFKKMVIPENILADLQKVLQQSHSSKKNFHKEALKNIEKEYFSIQDKLEILLDTLLARRITEEEYDKKAYALKNRQHELDTIRMQHSKADEKFAITVSFLLSLASRAHELFESSKVEQKRELLNFVFWNFSLERGKLVYKLKKPFDVLVRASDCQVWLPGLDSN